MCFSVYSQNKKQKTLEMEEVVNFHVLSNLISISNPYATRNVDVTG